VTQWVRYGVDTENPWDSFNTLGIKLSEIRKLEGGYLENGDGGAANEEPKSSSFLEES
jgi:hypothetical protein